MSAVFKKELRSYFCNPIGYIMLALYFFFTGIFFSAYYEMGVPDGSFIILNSLLLLVIVAPLLTMRMISEDRRQKVDQALFCAPVSLTKIVLGKFLAALAMFGICNLLYVVYELIFSFYCTVNWLSFLNCLIGFFLVGAGLIAIGLFISSLTESPIVSFIITFTASMLMLYLDSIAQMLGLDWLTKGAQYISFYSRFYDAANGIFNLADTLYLLSFVAFFIFLTVRSLEKKRWS